MGSFSLAHWVVVLAIVLILFGAGRFPKAMGDLARGMRAFRSGMRNDDATAAEAGQLAGAADQKPI
jgi:sec-independent protein translocase protein TatA